MELFIKEISLMINFKVMEKLIILQANHMKVSGKKVNLKEKVYSKIRMVSSIEDNL